MFLLLILSAAMRCYPQWGRMLSPHACRFCATMRRSVVVQQAFDLHRQSMDPVAQVFVNQNEINAFCFPDFLKQLLRIYRSAETSLDREIIHEIILSSVRSAPNQTAAINETVDYLQDPLPYELQRIWQATLRNDSGALNRGRSFFSKNLEMNSSLSCLQNKNVSEYFEEILTTMQLLKKKAQEFENGITAENMANFQQILRFFVWTDTNSYLRITASQTSQQKAVQDFMLKEATPFFGMAIEEIQSALKRVENGSVV